MGYKLTKRGNMGYKLTKRGEMGWEQEGFPSDT